MIIANECVASHIFYLDLPGIYRIHEEPKEEKIREFLGYINTLGYNYKGNMKDLSPKNIQGLLKTERKFPITFLLVPRQSERKFTAGRCT